MWSKVSFLRKRHSSKEVNLASNQRWVSIVVLVVVVPEPFSFILSCMCQREATRHKMNTTPVTTIGNPTKRRTKKAASIQKVIIKSDLPVELVTSQGSVSHIVPPKPADNPQPAEMEEFDPDQFLSQIRDQMKQDKDDKELIELAQVLEDQLPDELLPPTLQVICPLHPTKFLKEFVSKMGNEFVKCPLEGCPVFCAKKDLQESKSGSFS